MKKLLITTMMLLLCLLLNAQNYTMVGKIGSEQAKIKIKKSGNKVKAEVFSCPGCLPIDTEGTWKGNTISMEGYSEAGSYIKYLLTIDGNTIKGTETLWAEGEEETSEINMELSKSTAQSPAQIDVLSIKDALTIHFGLDVDVKALMKEKGYKYFGKDNKGEYWAKNCEYSITKKIPVNFTEGTGSVVMVYGQNNNVSIAIFNNKGVFENLKSQIFEYQYKKTNTRKSPSGGIIETYSVNGNPTKIVAADESTSNHYCVINIFTK